MNRSKGHGGGSYNKLTRSIENKVLNCLDLYKAEGHKEFATYAIYDYCLKVDSSLRRIKKRQLEMVIEKVLEDMSSSELRNDEQ